ncbi:NAD-dependent formate dehydrogenase, alpha subunit domain protein [Paraburkholderia caffeinilytica]|nr:NAD-dependent formate dehydrogenase, alpha subunit domain protein [Paraburkholderia caffeinilytica]
MVLGALAALAALAPLGPLDKLVELDTLVALAALFAALALQTTCPSRQSVWHAKACARPSIVTRHSWHTPIPHSAARGWPLTDVRVPPPPAMASAAATVVPASTSTFLPSIVT